MTKKGKRNKLLAFELVCCSFRFYSFSNSYAHPNVFMVSEKHFVLLFSALSLYHTLPDSVWEV